MTVEAVDEKNDENRLLFERKSILAQAHYHQLLKESRKLVRTRLETLNNHIQCFRRPKAGTTVHTLLQSNHEQLLLQQVNKTSDIS